MHTLARLDGELQHSEERRLKERTPGERYLQLDAMRGIAAICVVFHHWQFAFNMGVPHFWLVPICSGSQAVMLFFTLSGFVLSLPYLQGTRRPYWLYLKRRFWRIYVPFAAAVALSAVGALIFQGYRLPLTPWYYETWQTPVTFWLLIQQLLMVPLNSLNTAFWSLSVEVQFSLIMPFIATMVRRLPLAGSLALLVLWGWTLPLVRATHISLSSVWFFAQYGPLFLLGAIVAKYRAGLAEALRSLGRGRWLVLVVSLILYFDYHRADWRTYSFLENYEPFVSGIGAAGMIVCSLAMVRVARLLEHSVSEYFGRISYSLYLVHSIVIFSVLDLFFGKLSVPTLTVLVVIISLGLAHLFCIAVEEPSLRVGKRLGSFQSLVKS